MVKTINLKYKKQKSKDNLSLQLSAIKDLKKFVIVDDLLATGGTAKSVKEMLKSQKKEILALSVVVELEFLKGFKNIDLPVFSEVKYK